MPASPSSCLTNRGTIVPPGFESGRFLFLSVSGGIAETVLLLWLLVKGAKGPRQEELVSVT
jgi:hypothetical protein